MTLDAKQTSEAGPSPNQIAAPSLSEGPTEESLTQPPNLSAVETRLDELLDLFRSRLRYDQGKDEVIRRITDELNASNREALKASKEPLLIDLLLFCDSLRQFQARVAEKEMWPTAEFADQLVVLSSEMTELLERQDVHQWISTGVREADRRAQRVIAVEPTPDLAQDGMIVRVTRPGYAHAGRILRPEDVVISRYAATKQGEGQ